jgi:hypothetical protein
MQHQTCATSNFMLETGYRLYLPNAAGFLIGNTLDSRGGLIPKNSKKEKLSNLHDAIEIHP